MGEQQISAGFTDEQLRSFMQALLADVRALERLVAEERLESGVRRIGAEQEMFLVDRVGRPLCKATEVLAALDHGSFTHELALFNLEANLQPHRFGGSCLSAMEAELAALVELAREKAAGVGGRLLLAGILPTLSRTNLGLDSMVPNPRYLALNRAMTQMRGGEFHFRIKGIDEIELRHDNVMLESCNTSFQVHFQVGPREFARLYNLAQAITGPVLAAAVNSPLLLGKRLWKETRVALFQQSVDTRSPVHQVRGLRPRVSFGDDWIHESVLEIFREDIARFRVVLATQLDEDPEVVVARGETPLLTALRLHNGTVYRWNRACYGITDGIAHLRIENRVLPAGPSVLDEMGNAAFFFGLMSAMAEAHPDVRSEMSFDDAKANFLAAARHGLRANMIWFGGKEYTAPELILEQLLPQAREGLHHAGIVAADIDRYLGVVEDRVKSRTTGAMWILRSLAAMEGRGTLDQRMCALVRATLVRQQTGDPVHCWELASLSEFEGWRDSYLRVGQFMTTDLFTVRPEDVVDLAASLMDWRHIRHVPVEDDDGRLVGLVSHRSLLRLIGQGMKGADLDPAPVKSIMIDDPVTVTPTTPTLQAIELMRTHRVGCLPVVDADRHLVGIITERDLLRVASMLLEQQLRESAEGKNDDPGAAEP